MKIAITTQGPTLKSAVDPRFGRAAGFIVIDTATGDSEYHDNAKSQNLSQGAGLQAAMNVASHDVKAVITGHVGPKAYTALQKGGIEVYCTDCADVEDALKSFLDGKLQKADAPNTQGHW